jgi:hypothetical protein
MVKRGYYHHFKFKHRKPLLFVLLSHRDERDGRGMLQEWGNEEVHTGFWRGDLREGDQLRDPGVDGKIILKFIFKKWDGGVRTGLSWLRIRKGGGLL